MFHAYRKYWRNIRSSMPRADTFVAAMAKERDCSVVCGFIDEVSSTPANRPRGSKIGAPAQLKLEWRVRKCWPRSTIVARCSVMQVPIPLVPSICSDQTPPNQIPQYLKASANDS